CELCFVDRVVVAVAAVGVPVRRRPGRAAVGAAPADGVGIAGDDGAGVGPGDVVDAGVVATGGAIGFAVRGILRRRILIGGIYICFVPRRAAVAGDVNEA